MVEKSNHKCITISISLGGEALSKTWELLEIGTLTFCNVFFCVLFL